jgi:DNA-binding transcriptional MerR regulator
MGTAKMSVERTPPSPETITNIRQQYADGVPVVRILAENKVTKDTLYHWVDGGPSDPARRLPPIPRRQTQRRSSDDPAGARRLLVARLWRAAARQVRDIEQRLKGVGQDLPERERDVRALAVLVKTLRELAAFDEAHPAAQTRTDPDDDDTGPRDIDEFRRELARKMDALVARRAARVHSDSESRTD